MTPEELAELHPDLLLLESRETYDSCIVGLVERAGSAPCVCYDVNKVIKCLTDGGMTEEEAYEFFDYNIIGAYMGEKTPAFLWPLEVEDDDPQTSDT